MRWYLFTSTIGVYAPAEKFVEDAMWENPPSPNDRFAGYAKRMGELQAEAYAIEYGWNRVSIVRPANIYGAWDNFHPANAMVIPSLIKRAIDAAQAGKGDPLVVWGDGSTIRDFLHADDCARGILLAVEKGVTQPLNLGSGEAVPVKKIVEIILSLLPSFGLAPPRVEWDTTKPKGDLIRLMDVRRAESHGWRREVPIEEGLRRTMRWYLDHKEEIDRHFNVFTQKTLA